MEVDQLRQVGLAAGQDVEGRAQLLER
jgi:hypothetical protein